MATVAGGEAIIGAAIENFGRIDIFINNAGNQRNVKFSELTEQDINAVYAVLVQGAFCVTQPAYRMMAKQNYGRIVLVSSQSCIFGNPVCRNYGFAKTAMIGLMNVIAQELPAGIASRSGYGCASFMPGRRLAFASSKRVLTKPGHSTETPIPVPATSRA